MNLSDFEEGLLVGVLIGEGHFGGDARQAHITLRMHLRHEILFRWLAAKVPGSKLYGPYRHSGRAYFQWMCRGEALRTHLVPLLKRRLTGLDGEAEERFRAMCERYNL